MIKKNRISTDKEEIKKKMDDYERSFYKKTNILLTKFNDNKCIFLITNILSNEMTEKERWNKKSKEFYTIPIPKAIKYYTKYMKGTDLSNQLISYYEMNRKLYKFWKRIFFHLIDMAIINSYILFKLKTGKKISQIKYRIDIVKAIEKRYEIKSEVKEKNNCSSIIHFPI